MNNSIPIPLLMRLPPPLAFLLTYLAGTVGQHFAPLAFPAGAVGQGAHFLGVGLVGCALLLVLSSAVIFLLARTTLIPFHSASKLVTWGPYWLTRNPMYVSLVSVYLGVAGIRAEWWPLLLLPLPVLFLQRIVIPFEERRLAASFGETYTQYRTRVRRWL